MSGISGFPGLFRGARGDRAAIRRHGETEAEHAIPCRDISPVTVAPAVTNGGALRSMDNHALAQWLAETAACLAERSGKDHWTEADFFKWLCEPVNANGSKR